jgi:2-polyprenyl-3-methyl-5-hydroxy-6-metoxy-1,4-benzoquinol methylase
VSGTATVQTEVVEAFADRVFTAGLGAIDILTMYLGDRLGYYASLASAGPATAPELAARCSTDGRYTREWLEQQAVTGVLEVDETAAGPDDRRYALPAAHAEVLTRPDSLSAMAWLPRLLVGSANTIGKVADAFRTGRGVPWADYGPDVMEGQGDQNRPIFEHLLAQEWLPAIPDVYARLREGGARVADVCCGVGWSAIALARHFPDITVDGFDLDPASIDTARLLASEAGVLDRVSFHLGDAAEPVGAEGFDVAFVFESIHDLARPVEVLETIRQAVKPSGAVLVMDERVADTFTAPGDEVERLMYGYSVLLCLPSSMSEQPSAATGTAMRPSTMARYATEAGFTSTEEVPIDHPFFRLYRLR